MGRTEIRCTGGITDFLGTILLRLITRCGRGRGRGRRGRGSFDFGNTTVEAIR